MEIGGTFLNVIENMYDDVSYCVKINSCTTDPIPSNVGVKQGCVLSPTIFNLFLSDLPDIFDASCDPVYNFDSPLNCMMFADDIIILSESAEGLQNSLDKLKSYCDKWQLTLNTDKTKVMIFNKGGHPISKYKFKYGTCEILTTQKYCYLGIIFTSSGLFNEAIKSLCDKASKAFFLLRKHNIRENVKLTLKLFNSLVLPILYYGSEVWAPYLFKNLKETNFQSLCDSAPIEKINVKLCKYILGVNRKSTNAAVKAELGQFPLSIKAMQLSFKYWNRLCALDSDSLVKKAYLENLLIEHKNHSSWSKCLYNFSNIFNLESSWENQNETAILHFGFLKQKMENLYTNQWRLYIENSSKLRTFSKIKKQFSLESYLLHLPLKMRRNFTKLRVSSHHLACETGRYNRPVIPFEKRICQFCYLNNVESEMHFVVECPFYIVERENLYNDLHFLEINPGNPEIIFDLLMTTMDYDVCSVFCKFINACFEKRNQYFGKSNGGYVTNSHLSSHVEFLRLSHALL
jgi:hypothetical protein